MFLILNIWGGFKFFLKMSLVGLVTVVVTGGNSNCGLILQQKLVEQLLCLKYNTRPTGVSLYSAAKQTPVVLIKEQVSHNGNLTSCCCFPK